MKNKGVTLVALIITIIILLILATVSISLVINNNILDKAQHGVDKYSEEEELEQIKLAVASAQLKGNGYLTTDNLNSELQDKFGEDKEAIDYNDFYSLKLDKNYRIYKNGKVEEGVVLPDEYQQVEYIESTGAQYIDTGLLAKDHIDICLEIVGSFSATAKNKYIFGCSEGSTYHLLGIAFGSLDFVGQKGVGGSEQIIKQADTNMHMFELDLLNNTASLDSDLNVQLENSGNQYINQNYFLFSINHGGKSNYAASFAMYTCKIIDKENKCVRNFIPCYSTKTVTDADGTERSKNTIGMYDIMECKFYVNKGKGTFLKGEDV